MYKLIETIASYLRGMPLEPRSLFDKSLELAKKVERRYNDDQTPLSLGEEPKNRAEKLVIDYIRLCVESIKYAGNPHGYKFSPEILKGFVVLFNTYHNMTQAMYNPLSIKPDKPNQLQPSFMNFLTQQIYNSGDTELARRLIQVYELDYVATRLPTTPAEHTFYQAPRPDNSLAGIPTRVQREQVITEERVTLKAKHEQQGHDLSAPKATERTGGPRLDIYIDFWEGVQESISQGKPITSYMCLVNVVRHCPDSLMYQGKKLKPLATKMWAEYPFDATKTLPQVQAMPYPILRQEPCSLPKSKKAVRFADLPSATPPSTPEARSAYFP